MCSFGDVLDFWIVLRPRCVPCVERCLALEHKASHSIHRLRGWGWILFTAPLSYCAASYLRFGCVRPPPAECIHIDDGKFSWVSGRRPNHLFSVVCVAICFNTRFMHSAARSATMRSTVCCLQRLISWHALSTLPWIENNFLWLSPFR